MNDFKIKCPCCDTNLLIKFNESSGVPTAFLLSETNHSRAPTQQELEKLGIELGTIINHIENL